MLYASSRLDLVVSVSEYSREAYVDRFGKSGPIIYNQIDTGTYNKTVSGTEIRAEYDLDQRPVILFVGRVARSKRVHELIEVYNNVLMSEPDTVLLIVGRSDNQKYSDRIQRCIDSSGGQIVQAGFVPEDELPSYYAAADVYATCSIKEGFNLTIAEAEACGTPTVAYDIGAHSEVMSNGTLVDQGNTDAFTQAILQTLSEDSDLH
jgi:1,2-diacylglycerol 3-alpha-glucosyltransferase